MKWIFQKFTQTDENKQDYEKKVELGDEPIELHAIPNLNACCCRLHRCNPVQRQFALGIHRNGFS